MIGVYDMYSYGDEENILDTREYEWEDIEHNIRLISDLGIDHLKNILSGFGNGLEFYGQGWKYNYIKKELENRRKL